MGFKKSKSFSKITAPGELKLLKIEIFHYFSLFSVKFIL